MGGLVAASVRFLDRNLEYAVGAYVSSLWVALLPLMPYFDGTMW